MKTHFDINLSDYESECDSLSIGQQIHLNHKDCPSGTDSKKRLYIKKIDNNFCVGYCHHCGGKGASKKRGYVNALKELEKTGLFNDGSEVVLPTTTTTPTKVKLVEYPTDIDPTLQSAPKEIVEWFVKSGVTLSTNKIWDAGYSPSYKGFVMSTCDGFQVRLHDAAKSAIGSRYLTFYTGDPPDKECPIFPSSSSSKTIVIVEDYLSAVKCASYLDCYSIWAVGTNNHEKISKTINTYAKHCTNVKIMFDNDKPDIQLKAAALRDYLTLSLNHSPEIEVCDNPTDPKHMRIADLKKYVL